METTDLDRLQQEYRQAVEEWIARIREEEALATSADHSVISLDDWEQASFKEKKARDKAQDAKKEYEGALRRRFYGF